MKVFLWLTIIWCFLLSSAYAQTPLDIFKNSFNGVAAWYSIGFPNHDEVKNLPLWGNDQISQRWGFEIFTQSMNLGGGNPMKASFDSAESALLLDSLRNGQFDYPTKRIQFANLKGLLKAIKEKGDSSCTLEFGLGLDFSYTSRPKSDLIDIRTPALSYFISTYLNLPDSPPSCLKWATNFYIGVTAGISSITNGTAYGIAGKDSLAHYQITGSTFAYEAAIGYAIPGFGGSFQPILEFSYQNLAFEGVQYKLINPAANPPSSSLFPKRIDLSGYHITLAFQIGKK